MLRKNLDANYFIIYLFTINSIASWTYMREEEQKTKKHTSVKLILIYLTYLLNYITYQFNDSKN